MKIGTRADHLRAGSSMGARDVNAA